MIRMRIACVLAVSLAIGSAGVLEADVKSQEKSLFKLEGIIGGMVNVFGGKAAREGVVTTVAVRGDRKASLTDNSGQIIDLAEEKIYDVDLKDKSYKVTTFAEVRRRIEEAERKAREDVKKAESRKSDQKKDESDKEVEIDFSVKESGQKKTINGFDCRELVTTITVREKGKTLEQSGGLVLTVNAWLTSSLPAMKEVGQFDRRYAEKLKRSFGPGASADQMAMAAGMYPGLKEAFARFQAEGINADGTAIQTTMKMESVKTAEQTAQENKQESDPKPSGLGGLIGGLGRRATQRKDEGSGDKNRATIMTITHEVMSVSTSVAQTDTAIPAGFKQK